MNPPDPPGRYLITIILVLTSGVSLGCGNSGGGASARASPAGVREPGRNAASVLVCDLGEQIAHGQEIRTVFTLENPDDQLLILTDAIVLVPCCSEIGPLPERVAPRSSVEIPTLWRVGTSSGAKCLDFLVYTASAPREPYRLRLLANLRPGIELDLLDFADLRGSGGGVRWRYRLTTRRNGMAGRGDPRSIAIAPPFVLKSDGPPATASRDGLVESSRDFLVELPQVAAGGAARASIDLRWEEGHVWGQPIDWSPRPPIATSPAGLTLVGDHAGQPHEVVLRSSDGDFSIVGVDLPKNIARCIFDRGRGAVHTLHIVPAPGAASVGDVVIRTDHRLQAEVRLSVMSMPGSGAGGGER